VVPVKRRFEAAAAIASLFLTVAHAIPAVVPAIRQLDVNVAMRDGVRLSANVFYPVASGRYPAILLRTPYDKGGDITPNFQSFVDHGYAVVVQDVRGRYDSGGVFEPINQEIQDGDDTLNWIARQPWSDGNVGMYGGSYLGIAQWKAALSHNPHLKAIFPYVSGDDDYRDRFYSSGGAMKLGHRLLWVAENMREPGYRSPDFRKYVWAVPVRSADALATGRRTSLWQQVADHPDYDKFWKDKSVREHLKDIHVPVYSVGGWYDNYVESDLDAFTVLSKSSRVNRIMIGPWPHTFNTPFPNVSFGKGAIVPLRPEQLKWFDRWVKGRDVPDGEHAVRIFVMGINKWRDEDEWPLARARGWRLYLGGKGHANTLSGDGVLSEQPVKRSAPDRFTYDSKNPAPTMGGAVCCDVKVYPWGPMDQRPVEKRRDVLVYTTAALKSQVEVTGPVKVFIQVSSTAPDTDFTAKLVDVFPSGEARNLTDGILRARYRDSLEKPKPMNPGETYKLAIDMGVTSNVFLPGHRIRLEISSSNFPRFDRNPNTGRAIADEKDFRKATQTVFHDRGKRSFLVLPVVPSVPAELTSTKPTRYVTKRTPMLAR
jgi:putative CocE/NonD family hydrolase